MAEWVVEERLLREKLKKEKEEVRANSKAHAFNNGTPLTLPQREAKEKKEVSNLNSIASVWIGTNLR